MQKKVGILWIVDVVIKFIKDISYESKLFLKYLIISIVFFHGVNFFENILNLDVNVKIKNFEVFGDELNLFLTVIFLAPIFEEVIFRLPLKKNKLFILSIFLIFLFNLSITEFKIYFYILSSIFILTIILNYFYNINSIKYSNIFISCVLFVLIHFTNYDYNNIENSYLLPLLLLFFEKIFLTFLLVKIRFKLNLVFSFLLHSYYNFYIYLIYLIL